MMLIFFSLHISLVAALTGDGGYDGCGFDCSACCGCGSNKVWQGSGCCGGCYEGEDQGKSGGLKTCDPSTGLNPVDHRYGCVCYAPTWDSNNPYASNTFGVCEPGEYCHPAEASFCMDTPPVSDGQNTPCSCGWCVGKTTKQGLPMHYNLPMPGGKPACHSKCSEVGSNCVGIGYEADRDLCYIYFATRVLCNAATLNGFINTCDRSSDADDTSGVIWAQNADDDGNGLCGAIDYPYRCYPNNVEEHTTCDGNMASEVAFPSAVGYTTRPGYEPHGGWVHRTNDACTNDGCQARPYTTFDTNFCSHLNTPAAPMACQDGAHFWDDNARCAGEGATCQTDCNNWGSTQFFIQDAVQWCADLCDAQDECNSFSMVAEYNNNCLLSSKGVPTGDEPASSYRTGWCNGEFKKWWFTKGSSAQGVDFQIEVDVNIQAGSILDYLPFDAVMTFHAEPIFSDDPQAEFLLGAEVYAKIELSPLVNLPHTDIEAARSDICLSLIALNRFE